MPVEIRCKRGTYGPPFMSTAENS